MGLLLRLGAALFGVYLWFDNWKHDRRKASSKELKKTETALW